MAVITIAQVLEHVEEFERMLAEFYANVSHRATREGVRLLMDYMSRHRRRTHIALFKLPVKSVEQIHRICNTPLKYEPHGADRHSFEGVELSPDATAAEVLDAAITFDERCFFIKVLRNCKHHTCGPFLMFHAQLKPTTILQLNAQISHKIVKIVNS